jgi:asparagine synthase (glutamine-hydrolysing)
MQNLILNLRKNLERAVNKNKASALLLSGGLDTSILAGICHYLIGINVSLEKYSSDIKYTKILENFLNLKVYYLRIKMEEAISVIPEVIKILKSFDPAIPNDIVVYFGIKFAKELKLKSIITGDGADEIFAGYSYMEDIENLDEYIKKIVCSMCFSTNNLGKFFGVKIIQPYCDKKIIDFALKLPKELKIRKEKDKIFGKWILRKAFENFLPKEIIWQDKRPLEYGSGMTKLREIISSKISDKEFEEKKKLYSIKFMNKEHLYYYEIYKNVVGEIPHPKKNEKPCPYCSAGMKISSFHCKICGGVLNWKK